jgi:hypothetical protein
MNHLFPYDNIVAGILILIVGFLFHWVGQLVSVFNWKLAERIGFQEKGLPGKYKDYEHGTAMADVVIGWIYAIAGIGLILGTNWSYKLAWISGAIFSYHGLIAWFNERNRRKAGYRFMSNTVIITWSSANIITGVLAIALAWTAF